jgi:hypothetical protein
MEKRQSTRSEQGFASRRRLAERSRFGPPALRELIDTNLPADQLERLASVDGLLREAAVRDGPAEAPSLLPRARFPDGALPTGRCKRKRRTSEEAVWPSLRLVTTQSATAEPTRRRTEETHELKLSFAELALIYKTLQAAKTLGALPPQDELLNDTIQLVDQALNRAV